MYKHPGSKLHKTYKYVYKYIKVNLEKADLVPSRSGQKFRFPTAESPINETLTN